MKLSRLNSRDFLLNAVYERARFNLRKQDEGERSAVFINDHYVLVEHYEYGELRDQMIRDRLAVGLSDHKLSEKLQLDSNLTVDSAITMVCQSESVHIPQKDIHKNDDKQIPVYSVEKKRRQNSNYRRSMPPRRPPPQPPQSLQTSKCTRCVIVQDMTLIRV